jgi:hypothetical protein
MSDNGASFANRRTVGKTCAEVITSDTIAQPVMRELYVGTGGDIVGKLIGDDPDGADRTWKNVSSGTRLPYAFAIIKTASTAADMLAIN